MEDIFYCGNGDFSEAEEKKIKAFVPECKKIWRIKTRQEFVDTLGPGWASYYRNDEGAWNTEGRMEWLLGKPLHEVLSNNEDREHWNGMEKSLVRLVSTGKPSSKSSTMKRPRMMTILGLYGRITILSMLLQFDREVI